MIDNITKIRECRVCESPRLYPVIDFGETALANSYLTKEELEKINAGEIKEFKANLSYSLCQDCGAFQLNEVINPDLLFKNYLYASSTSGNLLNYFEKYCNDVIERFKLNEKSFVIVVASNDGVELRNFVKRGIPCLGVEPAKNLSDEANKNDFPTLNTYLNLETASDIVRKHGKADCVIFNNVAAHVPDIKSFFNGVRELLKNDGVAIFENSSLLSMLENKYVDILYHEHVFEWGCLSLQKILDLTGLKMFDWQNTEPHGGSFRCFIQPKESEKYDVSKFLIEQKNLEEYNDMYSALFYDAWIDQLSVIKNKFKRFIREEREKGKTFCAFGYPAKATTLCKFLKIEDDLFEYVVENSVVKQNLFTPGNHLKIVSPDYFKENPTDYCVVMAWNFYDMIVKNNPEYKGEFINPCKIK